MTPGDAVTVGRLVPSHDMSLWSGSRQRDTSSSTPALGTPQETQPASRLSPRARVLALKHRLSVSSDSSSLPEEGVVLRGAPQWLPGSPWVRLLDHPCVRRARIARPQDRPLQAVLPDWGRVFEIPLQSPQRQNQGGGLTELSSSFQLQSGKKEMGLTGKETFTLTMGMCDEVCDSRSPKGTGGLSLRQPAQGLGQPKGPRGPGEPGRGLEGEALGCGPWVG